MEDEVFAAGEGTESGGADLKTSTLLPDVDVIDDISENLSEEPRFMKLNGTSGSQPDAAIDVDAERE